MTPDAVASQLQSIGEDLRPDAVKTGMLFSAEIIERVSKEIAKYGWNNIVIDPVMIAKGGASLLQTEAIIAMKKHLIPLSMVITPNIPEAEVLTDTIIRSMEDKRKAANELYRLGAKHVIIKGGHEEGKNGCRSII